MESMELLRLLDEVKKLSQQIDTLQECLKKPEDEYRSKEIKDLATALAKAQGEMSIAGKSKVNPYFKSKYADWESVVSASRPALTKYGIAVTMDIVTDQSGATYCDCVMTHTSGQWKKSRMRFIPPKNDIQAIASYNTSMKRLLYCNTVCVVVGDEDDDGEAAVAETRDLYAKGTALNTKYDPKSLPADCITKEQLEELEYELSQYPDIAEMILDGLKLQSIADLPKSKFLSAINRVREIKQIRNGK